MHDHGEVMACTPRASRRENVIYNYVRHPSKILRRCRFRIGINVTKQQTEIRKENVVSLLTLPLCKHVETVYFFFPFQVRTLKRTDEKCRPDSPF